MKKLLGICLLVLVGSANASIIKVSETDFLASAGLITFSEFAINTQNPIYNPANYGGGVDSPIVSFGGWFLGQSLSTQPNIDCPGAAASACIVGSPTGPLQLDGQAPATIITTDGANPSSPVLSGTPRFNGGVALLFSVDQFAVGFDGGFFDAVASTAITAFDRNGNFIGSVANTVTGIEFLGLISQSVGIAGVFLDLVGNEPAGFAIDNVRFGRLQDVNPDLVDANAPASLAMLLLGVGFIARRRIR